MRVNRRKYIYITEVLDEWEKNKLISFDQNVQLKKTIEIKTFDWKWLARYSFVLAVITILMSVFLVLADRKVISWAIHFFGKVDLLNVFLFIFLSLILLFSGFFYKRKYPEKKIKTEAIFSLGIIFYSGALFSIGKIFHLSHSDFILLTFLGCISYGIVAILVQSSIIWVFTILSLGACIGQSSTFSIVWFEYFLGTRYDPINFIVFSFLLISISHLFNWPQFRKFKKETLKMGLLYLFLNLWFLSFFGSISRPFLLFLKPINTYGWGVISMICIILSIAHGLKYNNSITRNFGFVFLLINLYTLYFCWFWETINIGVFFAIFALSLWGLGSFAEKLSNMEKNIHNFGEDKTPKTD